MSAIIASITHPYWGALGTLASTSRAELRLSQAKVAARLKLSVREYAALESGFIPPEIADALGRASLAAFDEVFGWEEGTASKTVRDALTAVNSPVPVVTFGDRSAYPAAAWVRLGTAVQKARQALRMSKPVLGYAMKSSSKTVMRLEEGRIHGDPRTAPPGDYNSERYMLKRLPLLEMALEWEAGQAAQILEGSKVRTAA
jgi:transcriptional regulator with XRE-family HTH domain